tara:strand:- start:53 stop:352 length:300 start_codon:yes stop_codon:yes gene_type:complete
MVITNPPEINNRTLDMELQLLELPGFIGTAVQSREKDADGAWQQAERHLIVKCDSLTQGQQKAVRKTVKAHIALPFIVEDPEEPPLSPEETKALRALLK